MRKEGVVDNKRNLKLYRRGETNPRKVRCPYSLFLKQCGLWCPLISEDLIGGEDFIRICDEQLVLVKYENDI